MHKCPTRGEQRQQGRENANNKKYTPVHEERETTQPCVSRSTNKSQTLRLVEYSPSVDHASRSSLAILKVEGWGGGGGVGHTYFHHPTACLTLQRFIRLSQVRNGYPTHKTHTSSTLRSHACEHSERRRQCGHPNERKPKVTDELARQTTTPHKSTSPRLCPAKKSNRVK